MYPFHQNKSPLPLRSALLIVIAYFIGYQLIGAYLLSWLCQSVLHSYAYYMALQLILYLLLAVGLYYLARPLFAESDYNCVGHHRDNLQHGMKSLLLMYVCMIGINLCLNFITGQNTSANQSDITSLTYSYPLITFLLSVVLAPTVEELVFRGAIFRSLRNYSYPLAITVSSLLFGLMHVLSSLLAGNWLDCLYLIVYAMLGYFLAENYERSGSIYTSIILHTIINAISIGLLLASRYLTI